MYYRYVLSPKSWRLRLEHGVAAAILLVVSFRFAAIPFILLSAVEPPRYRRAYRAVVSTMLFLTLASPIDVGVPGVAVVAGNHASGARLVRATVGMPAHTELTARYGEYVSLGCSGLPCVYPPRWWVVWW